MLWLLQVPKCCFISAEFLKLVQVTDKLFLYIYSFNHFVRSCISETFGIKRRFMIYLPLCSSSNRNPGHSPRWLHAPQSPWRPTPTPSTQSGEPWWHNDTHPLIKKERETKREKQSQCVLKIIFNRLTVLFCFESEKMNKKQKESETETKHVTNHRLHEHRPEKIQLPSGLKLSSLQMFTHIIDTGAGLTYNFVILKALAD